MKAFLLLLLALASFFGGKQSTRPTANKMTARAKPPQQTATDYSRKAVAFIRQVKKHELESEGFILQDTPAHLTTQDCLQDILTDKQFYSPAELVMLKAQAYPTKMKWEVSDFPNVRLIRKDTVDAIFKVYSRHWTYFHDHIGRDFNEFSAPIFLRNDTYCLFYDANFCGGLCGGGSLILYKKEGGQWKKVKTYCEWVS